MQKDYTLNVHTSTWGIMAMFANLFACLSTQRSTSKRGRPFCACIQINRSLPLLYCKYDLFAILLLYSFPSQKKTVLFSVMLSMSVSFSLNMYCLSMVELLTSNISYLINLCRGVNICLVSLARPCVSVCLFALPISPE